MSGPERGLWDEIAAALILHDHPFKNALTRPDDPEVMLRTDPKFWVCAQALSQADAVLPVVRARIDAAQADTAEAIAQAIERYECGSYCGEQCAAIAREHAATEGPCCDLHNRNCEPPSELCCWECTERNHPNHPPGEQCVMATTEGPRP